MPLAWQSKTCSQYCSCILFFYKLTIYQHRNSSTMSFLRDVKNTVFCTKLIVVLGLTWKDLHIKRRFIDQWIEDHCRYLRIDQKWNISCSNLGGINIDVKPERNDDTSLQEEHNTNTIDPFQQTYTIQVSWIETWLIDLAQSSHSLVCLVHTTLSCDTMTSETGVRRMVWHVQWYIGIYCCKRYSCFI